MCRCPFETMKSIKVRRISSEFMCASVDGGREMREMQEEGAGEAPRATRLSRRVTPLDSLHRPSLRSHTLPMSRAPAAGDGITLITNDDEPPHIQKRALHGGRPRIVTRSFVCPQ